MSDTHKLIGRAVIDLEFRKRLLENPDRTIAQEGYTVEAEVLDQLRNLDPAAAETAAQNLDSAFADRLASA